MLKISISGPPGSGKTTVAKVIEAKLRELGFNPLVSDADRVTPEQVEMRINGLRGTKNPILIDVEQKHRRMRA